MDTRMELITPQIAANYLERNTVNPRHISRRRVEELAKVIKAGHWQETHQGIAFYRDGTLADGQHRLSAVVLSGQSVKLLVTRGLPRESGYCVDNGVRRSIRDLLPEYNSQVVDALSFIANRLLNWRNVMPVHIQELSTTPIYRPLRLMIESVDGVRPPKGMGAAPIKAGIALRGLDDCDYVVAQYKAWVHLDYSGMTESVQAFLRQLSKRSATSYDASDLLCRSYAAFNPHRRDTTRVQVYSRGMMIEQLRDLVRGLVKDSSIF